MNWLTNLFRKQKTQKGIHAKECKMSGSTPEEQYALCLTTLELQGIISGQKIPDPPLGYSEKITIPIEVAKWAHPFVEKIESADKLANSGKIDMAFAIYASVIKSGVRCGVAAMSASFCCFHQDKWDLALQYIKMAEDFDPKSTRIQEKVKYIVKECAKRNVYEAAKATSREKIETGRVRFVEKKKLPGMLWGYDTYEVYQADSAEDAKVFLNSRNITEQQYYVIVETPEGIFRKDIIGFYTPSKDWRGNDWDRY